MARILRVVAVALALAGAARTACAQSAVTLKDDALDTVATFTTSRPLPKDMYRRDDYNQPSIRAYVDKATGREEYQLYVFVWYLGDWRTFTQMNYETMGAPASEPLLVISRDVHDCIRRECYLSEDVAIALDPALVRAWVATTDTFHSYWDFKLSAHSGDTLRLSVERSQFAEVVAAVDEYKVAHSLK